MGEEQAMLFGEKQNANQIILKDVKKTALFGILSAKRDFMLLDVVFVLQIALTEVKI